LPCEYVSLSSCIYYILFRVPPVERYIAQAELQSPRQSPLHLDMRSVLGKIAESRERDITIEPDWLSQN
ncbi:MAG: hypothetical protein WCN95_15855, partial [bacterium]